MSDMSTTERLAREVKNSLCIDGTLNSVLEAAQEDEHADTSVPPHAPVGRQLDWDGRSVYLGPERCPCGYPMPCVKTVPMEFCKA